MRIKERNTAPMARAAAAEEDDLDLQGASETRPESDGEGQDWLDWGDLADEKPPAAVLISVIEIEDEEDFGNGPFNPVRARVIVMTGKQKGQVFENERILKKGIRMKLTRPGQNVVGRIERYGSRKHPGLNDEWDGDMDLAKRALAKFGKVETAAPSSNGKAKSKPATEVPDDDDEPPF